MDRSVLRRRFGFVHSRRIRIHLDRGFESIWTADSNPFGPRIQIHLDRGFKSTRTAVLNPFGPRIRTLGQRIRINSDRESTRTADSNPFRPRNRIHSDRGFEFIRTADSNPFGSWIRIHSISRALQNQTWSRNCPSMVFFSRQHRRWRRFLGASAKVRPSTQANLPPMIGIRSAVTRLLASGTTRFPQRVKEKKFVQNLVGPQRPNFLNSRLWCVKFSLALYFMLSFVSSSTIFTNMMSCTQKHKTETTGLPG